MAAGQLWLFPPPKPLVERLGADFFRQLPESPGVYLMCGREEGVLYVGSAKNLRRRLTSYRVANPERLPRRMVRLLHRVTRIEIDECPNDAAARAREEMLICVLAPRFNRAGKVWPTLQSWRSYNSSHGGTWMWRQNSADSRTTGRTDLVREFIRPNPSGDCGIRG
jgi:predicted GIY-YIG superfamily endonuclease